MNDIVGSWCECPLSVSQRVVLQKGTIVPPWLFKPENAITFFGTECSVKRIDREDHRFELCPTSSDYEFLLIGYPIDPRFRADLIGQGGVIILGVATNNVAGDDE